MCYMMRCCFTGHRFLAEKDIPAVQAELKAAMDLLIASGESCEFLAGGALGFDTLAAEAVLSLRRSCSNVSLTLVLPCIDQSRRWRQSDQGRYERILAQADKVIYTAKTYYNGCMLLRDRYLAEHSDLCIAFLRPDVGKGGTLYTVNYCIDRGIPVVNLAERLVMLSEMCSDYTFA